MTILSPSTLETVTYSQQGWNAIVNSNFEKINDIWGGFASYWERDVVNTEVYPATAGDSLHIMDGGVIRIGDDSDFIFNAEQTDSVVYVIAGGDCDTGFMMKVDSAAQDGVGLAIMNDDADPHSAALLLGSTGDPDSVLDNAELGIIGLAFVGCPVSVLDMGDTKAFIKGIADQNWDVGNTYQGARLDFGITIPYLDTPAIYARLDRTGFRCTSKSDIATVDGNIDTGYTGLSYASYTGSTIDSSTDRVNVKGLCSTRDSASSSACHGYKEMANNNVAGMTDFISQQTLPMGVTSPLLMMIMVDLETVDAYALAHWDATNGVVLLSSGAEVSTTYNTAGHLNLYTSTGEFKIQNLIGATAKVAIWILSAG